tara:strand:+ start:5775 stop:8882 length:3108 start_codon:yes stop_codon:yes gene_type:complete
MNNWPIINNKMIDSVTTVLKSGKLNQWNNNAVKEFETKFANYMDCNYAIAVFNGTVALELCIKTLGLSTGDEVIVTPRTFIASASCCAWYGLKPVFVDVDSNSQNITLNTIKTAITKNTKAVILVHLAGWPCDLEEICNYCRKNNINIIEDCAQAHGAKYNNKSVGTWGDINAWSFCQDKIITTGGEGGMVTTNNADLYKLAWSLKDHGKGYNTIYNKPKKPGYKWLHENIGTNWRMMPIQAVIGIHALDELDNWVTHRRKIANIYNTILNDIDGIILTIPPEYIYHSYYKYYFFIDPEAFSITRDEIIQTINENDIFCQVGSCSEVYKETALQKYAPKEELIITKKLFDTSLLLKCDPCISEKQAIKNITTIKHILLTVSKKFTEEESPLIHYITDIYHYKTINSKYNKLIEHPSYTKLLSQYLNKIKIKWCGIKNIKRYIYYINNNNTIHIYFYNHLICSNKITDTVSNITINILFKIIKNIVLNKHVLLNFKYLLYILNLYDANIIQLINEQYKLIQDTKFRVDFKIYNNTIKFYIRHSEILNCTIDTLNNNIVQLFNLYNKFFKEYKKVALVLKSPYFPGHSSVNKLQKTLFENGYWLDISTPSENSIERELLKTEIWDNYNNIILDYYPDMTALTNYNNKKLIIIPSSYSHDHNMKLNKNESVKLYKNTSHTNILIRGVRPLDSTEAIISTGYIHKYTSQDIKISYLNCTLHKEYISNLKPDETTDNKNLLSKYDFFKTYNFDIKKELITIFLVWPVIDSYAILTNKIVRGPISKHKIFRPQFLNFEYDLYYENSILIQIINILQKTYNVAIKLHPSQTKMIDNKMYIFKGTDDDLPKSRANLNLNNIKDNKGWGISNLLKNHANIIIDYNYHEEILNYTNLGFIFYPSTVSWYTHIYNFPIIQISTKNEEDDWFKWLDVNMLTQKGVVQSIKYYRQLDKIQFNKNKLFNLKDVIFGELVYIEDLYEDLEDNLLNLIKKNLKSIYKITTNHPMFNNNGQESIALKLIKIIETKYNLIEPSTVIDVEPECR